jgi:ABC-type glycerol-3-phosphate transport system substrate-binding protein
MTWWVNDLQEYHESIVANYETTHPNVKIEVQMVQNEDYDSKLQNAMNAGDAPDILLSRGGGKMRDQANAGQLMDLTEKIPQELKDMLPTSYWNNQTVDGKVVAMPVSVVVYGIWYSQDLFEAAGIASPPATYNELVEDIAKLKETGVAPIAVGAKDAWPAANWYYFFALRQCTPEAITTNATSYAFDDPCWKKAAEDLVALRDIEPFQKGFLTTSAQAGAGSSAGLVANHKAAMELMGPWDAPVIASLTPDGQPLADLGAFPLPTMEGAGGSQTAQIATTGGFSCSSAAPVECADFLSWFVLDVDNEVTYYQTTGQIPSNPDAQAKAVTESYTLALLEGMSKADFIIGALDSEYGQNVGNTINQGVVDILAGNGTPDSFIKAIQTAAAKE